MTAPITHDPGNHRAGKEVGMTDHETRSRRRRSWLARWLRSTRGNMSVEMALLGPIFVVMLLGGIEFGRAWNEQIRLSGIARTNVQYAVENLGAAEVLDEITTMMDSDGQSPGPGYADPISVTAEQLCTCGGVAVECVSVCASGEPPNMYVEVTAQRDLALLFEFPAYPATLPLSATVRLRAR